VAKATGVLKSVVEELHNILKVYPNDAPSWLELGEIHLSLGDYPVSRSSRTADDEQNIDTFEDA
jgi:cytochrome c-type biogenesis protein CcmH/NrfG